MSCGNEDGEGCVSLRATGMQAVLFAISPPTLYLIPLTAARVPLLLVVVVAVCVHLIIVFSLRYPFSYNTCFIPSLAGPKAIAIQRCVFQSLSHSGA
jgi:hypothetical protein